MPAIDLSMIRFRPYQESEEPTDFGPNDYTPPPGVRVIDLSRIHFRPWEDNHVAGIGGVDIPDEGGGGGGPIEPGEPGTFSAFINQTANFEEHYVQYVLPTAVTSLYIYAEVWITQEMKDQLVDYPFTGQFSGDFINISPTTDAHGAWEGVSITNTNYPGGIIDGNIYWWDYWSDGSAKVLATAETWTAIEVAIRLNGTDWEASFKINGTQSTDGWIVFADTGDFTDLASFSAGSIFSPTGHFDQSYIDNVVMTTDNWFTEGGTSEFSDGFESGDTSAWTNTEGTVTPTTPPA